MKYSQTLVPLFREEVLNGFAEKPEGSEDECDDGKARKKNSHHDMLAASTPPRAKGRERSSPEGQPQSLAAGGSWWERTRDQRQWRALQRPPEQQQRPHHDARQGR